jgi:hypothetical protein
MIIRLLKKMKELLTTSPKTVLELLEQDCICVDENLKWSKENFETCFNKLKLTNFQTIDKQIAKNRLLKIRVIIICFNDDVINRAWKIYSFGRITMYIHFIFILFGHGFVP